MTGNQVTENGAERRVERPARLLALDALRGLIMVFMALDHANLLVAQKHSPGEHWGGAFPVYYSGLAFVTRFLTHLAAPGFFLLMGAGMALFAGSRQKRGWSKWQVIRHFLVRGALLVAVQLLIVNQAWKLSPGGWGIEIYVGVLVALGTTMILGSLLLWVRPLYLVAIIAALVVGTELLVPDPSAWGPGSSVPELVWLFSGGIIGQGGRALLWSNYPILPWLELTLFGTLLGRWVRDDPRKAFRRALYVGGAFLAAFAALRLLDGFGNIRPRMGDTWTDFLNPVKYPPSITFTLLTTGINLIVLWVLAQVETVARRVLAPLAVLGRAPLFFYLLHILLYVGIGHLLTPNGTSLVMMYPLWLLGLLVLFPLCLLYGGYKQRQPAKSVLHYL